MLHHNKLQMAHNMKKDFVMSKHIQRLIQCTEFTWG